MFSHVMIGTNDLARAKSFYDSLLGTLEIPPSVVDRHRIFFRGPGGVFGVTLPIDGEPASAPNGGTIGFACASPEQVHAWHDAGVAAGGTSIEDPPGLRPSGFYLAYLRDPDCNKICAMHRPKKA